LQPLIDKGYVRVLAATAPSSLPATRSLPLMSSALAGYEYSTWYAMYVSLATPKELMDHMNQALNKALKNPQLIDKVQAAGTEIHPGTQEEVLQWTRHDTEKWQKVIQSANISIE
jgi:tripartite-type tricarboxylate transporter receptor subunit TctC